MELIADILLVAGALGAGLYCFILGHRLKRFNDLEKGVGGAVAVLSTQVDELNKSLVSARSVSDQSNLSLQDLAGRAEAVANRLELIMASMHDVASDSEVQASDVSKSRDENDPHDASAPAEPENRSAAPTGETDEPTPAGLMFFRHGRTMGGAAP